MKEPWKNNELIRQNCRGVGQDQTTCSVQNFLFSAVRLKEGNFIWPGHLRVRRSLEEWWRVGHGLARKKK